MSPRQRTSRATAAVALLACALGPAAARADAPAPNDGMRWVSVGAQADNRHNQQALATLSMPVGRHAWVQAGAGQSRSDASDGGRHPTIVNGAVGLAGESLQATVSSSQRLDGSRYRQSDWGSSVDWKGSAGSVGVDVTHRRSRASGTVAVSNAGSGSSTVPAQARVSGTGVGLHGALQVGERASVYGSVARNHFKSTTTQGSTTSSSGGLLGSNPLLSRALLGGASVVNSEEVALDRSAMVGASYRWTKVAVSAEVASGQVHDNGGALHSVALKAAIDVAPGWRVTPGIGRGTADQGGQATYGSLAATYGW